MRTEVAVRLVRNLRRYRKGRRGTYWDQTGPFVPQQLIPLCTKAQERAAHEVIGAEKRLRAVRWIDAGRVRSGQRSLRFRSLMWNVKNAGRMQRTFASKDLDVRGKNLPVVIWANGVAVLWNGNHRVTANILLGRGRIRVLMYKKAR